MARIDKPVERRIRQQCSRRLVRKTQASAFLSYGRPPRGVRMPLDRAGKTLILKKSAGALELRCSRARLSMNGWTMRLANPIHPLDRLNPGRSVTERRRFGRGIFEIPLEPICEAGLEVVGGYLLHVDKL